MTNKKKLKLGFDIGRINHIISRKMDAAIINTISDNLTVSQAYVIDFISMAGKDKDIFQKDLEKHFAKGKNGNDETWEARRVMERIRYLAEETRLEGENRR